MPAANDSLTTVPPNQLLHHSPQKAPCKPPPQDSASSRLARPWLPLRIGFVWRIAPARVGFVCHAMSPGLALFRTPPVANSPCGWSPRFAGQRNWLCLARWPVGAWPCTARQGALALFSTSPHPELGVFRTASCRVGCVHHLLSTGRWLCLAGWPTGGGVPTPGRAEAVGFVWQGTPEPSWPVSCPHDPPHRKVGFVSHVGPGRPDRLHVSHTHCPLLA